MIAESKRLPITCSNSSIRWSTTLERHDEPRSSSSSNALCTTNGYELLFEDQSRFGHNKINEIKIGPPKQHSNLSHSNGSKVVEIPHPLAYYNCQTETTMTRQGIKH